MDSACGEATVRGPNGVPLANNNTAIAAQYGFQGLPHDFLTKLVDMRARHLGPLRLPRSPRPVIRSNDDNDQRPNSIDCYLDSGGCRRTVDAARVRIPVAVRPDAGRSLA
jgi:hypothetical protein